MYIEVNEPFNTKYDKYIIAFCPDTNSFFTTNERHFYWESDEEFDSVKEALGYFIINIANFSKIHNEIRGCRTFHYYLEWENEDGEKKCKEFSYDDNIVG